MKFSYKSQKYHEHAKNSFCDSSSFCALFSLSMMDNNINKLLFLALLYFPFAEKRYGIYRCGCFLSAILIFILVIVICIPLVLTPSDPINTNSEQNTYLLIALIVIFVIVGILIVLFINHQHRQAFKQRLKSEHGLYTLQRSRARRQGRNTSANGIELQAS